MIAATASVGACFGGDVECVTPWSALAWAKEYDVAVCAIGPGIVGTASRLGHGGLAAATAANAALAARRPAGSRRPRLRGG